MQNNINKVYFISPTKSFGLWKLLYNCMPTESKVQYRGLTTCFMCKSVRKALLIFFFEFYLALKIWFCMSQDFLDAQFSFIDFIHFIKIEGSSLLNMCYWLLLLFVFECY